MFLAGTTVNPADFAPSRTNFGTAGNRDVFVTQLDNSLTTHNATAIIRGSGDDYGFGLYVEEKGGGGGNVFITGWTANQSDFAPSRTTFGTAGSADVFITQLDNGLTTHNGTAILRSSANDYAYAIAVDGGVGGDVYVAGFTDNSSDFAPSRTNFGTAGGTTDAFVTKFSNDLATHKGTAILRSSGQENVYGLAIDGSGGDVLVVGQTSNQSDFSSSRSTFGTAGGGDAFVTKLSNDLTTHSVTAILRSSLEDQALAIAIDGSGGNIFVTGNTTSQSDFAPSRTTFGTTGDTDAFVTKFNNALTTHTATAIVGSSLSDAAFAIAIDGSGGDVFIAGGTNDESGFAPSNTIYGTTGNRGGFITRFNNSLSTHKTSTILTSSETDAIGSIAIDGVGGNIFVAGVTRSYSDFSTSRTVFGTTGSPSDAR